MEKEQEKTTGLSTVDKAAIDDVMADDACFFVSGSASNGTPSNGTRNTRRRSSNADTDAFTKVYEKKLVEAAQNGDSAAFEKLIELKRKDILYLAKRFSGTEDAEDLAQEAMIKIFKYLGDLKEPGKFSSWMFGIVRNVCFNAMKKKGRDISVAVDPQEEDFPEVEEERIEFLPQRFMESDERQQAVVQALETMKEPTRDTLLLYYYEGLSYKQIAEILNVNLKKVANQLLRGKQELQQRLMQDNKYHEIFEDFETQSKMGGAAVLPLAGTPVLTQILQADAARVVTPEMCDRFSTFLHDFLVGTMAAGAAVGGTAAATEATAETAAATAATTTTEAAAAETAATATTTSATLSNTAKFVLAASLTLTVGCGAFGLYLATHNAGAEEEAQNQQTTEQRDQAVATNQNNQRNNQRNNSDDPSSSPVSPESATTPADTAADQTPPLQPAPSAQAAPSEYPINTLPDMIGGNEAEALNAFTVYSVWRDSWWEFVDDVGAEYQGEIFDAQGNLYSMFLLDKQDKRLLLYGKDDGSGAIDVVYNFGFQAALPVPRMAEVILHFA